MASTTTTTSKYSDYYNSFKDAAYWRDVTDVNGSSVSAGGKSGLAVWNTSGTYGAGVISESMGYTMMLAALYNDKTTFDRLSATVQAAIKGNSRPLMPWYLGETQTNQFESLDNNSASDGDINIALAYVYADQAASVYGWESATANNELYYTLAKDYSAAIRQYDFSNADTDANNHILQDGFRQAGNDPNTSSGGFKENNWHPDYSDPRAYQLFTMYDTTGSAFWDRAQYYTTEAWKAVFNFGVSDQGRSENAQTGPIDASKYYVNISNPTYGNLQASDTYAGFTFERSGTEYTSDSSRLPMRILNYINAQENAGADEVVGIANANLKALNKAFADTNYWYITDKVEIAYPYTTGSGFTQDFTAAGLLALAGSDLLSDPAGTTTTVTNLNTEFGTNGMNGSTVYWNNDTQTGSGWAIGNGLAGDDVFNDALTLWGLTVYDAGNTDLARTALGASSPGLLSHMSAVDSRDPITGDLMISERGKKDTFIFSKEHFSTDSSESASTGTMRIVGFNRKQDKLGFETRDRLGTRKTTIKTFHTNSKANRLINKDTPFLLDKRTGELYTTVGSSTTDRFNDLSPFAQFIESDSSLGKIQASLI